MQLSLVAALSWPPRNEDSPETLGPFNTVLLSILHALVTSLLVMRLYARWRLSGGLRADDLLIFFAYITTSLFAAVGIYQEIVLKVDRHIWDFPPENSVASFKSSLAVGIVFAAATTFTKLSMLTLIHRITSAARDRLVTWLVMGTIVLVATDGVVFIIVELSQCRPLSLFWTVSFSPQNCIRQSDHLLAAGIINTTTDLIIVLLPIRTILHLKLPRRQLIGIQALLAGGILATIAGAVRVYYTWLAFSAPDHDITWRSHLAVALSALELYIGIICASLPASKPFFQRFFPRLSGCTRLREVAESTRARKKWPDDNDSAIGSANLHTGKRNSWSSYVPPLDMAVTSLVPPPAYTGFSNKTPPLSSTSLSPASPMSGLSYVGYQQQKLAWKPLISPPIVQSPITPTFRVRNDRSITRIDTMAPLPRLPPPDLDKALPSLRGLETPTSADGQWRDKQELLRPARVTSTPVGIPSSQRNAAENDNSPMQRPRTRTRQVSFAGISDKPPTGAHSAHSSSVFDFVAYEDGHISVHKAPKDFEI